MAGLEVQEIEQEVLNRGGEVVRDQPGHVLFKVPGLPTVAVHTTRAKPTARAPRKLQSFYRRLLEGRLRPERQVEAVADEPEPKVRRPRFRPRPAIHRPVSFLSPHRPEVIHTAVETIEQQKARERAAVMDRILNRAPEPPRVYQAQQGMLQWNDDRVQKLVHDPLMYKLTDTQFFSAYEQALVFEAETREEFFAILGELYLTPDAFAGVQKSVATWTPEPKKFEIAVLSNPMGRRLGMAPNHTYVRQGDRQGSESVVVGFITMPIPSFVHYGQGWEQGLDYERAAVRAEGFAK